jgi:hypothetical protein
MKKLLTLALFCLLSCLLTTAFGATLVQANIGGATTTTFTSGGTLSATGGFTNPTTLGSTLVAAVKIRQEALSGYVHSASSSAFTCAASGFSWVQPGFVGEFEDDVTDTHGGWEYFCYILNAAPMSVPTTASFVIPAGHVTASIEFSLFELSGILAYVEGVAGANQSSGAASAPNETMTFGSTPRLALTNLVGYPGSNMTAAAGWTLGPNDTVATIGQTEYALSVSGANTAQFVGTLTLYATHAIVFSLGSPSPAVPRHRGFVN